MQSKSLSQFHIGPSPARSLPSHRSNVAFPKSRLATSKFLTSKSFIFCTLALIVGYSMTTQTKMEHKARRLLEKRDRLQESITIDKGHGACDIRSPFRDAPNKPAEDSTKTLLASYPGSGKRFVWTVIKALTSYEAADDWNLSGRLGVDPLIVKTSWPHKEGTWSWGKDMDQVLILIRNPRRAIPSYHTMKWELDYATTWEESLLHIPDTYIQRPEVETWIQWRDENFNHEMDSWYNFYDFWFQDGFIENEKKTHPHCLNNDIDCQPKELVDFEDLYKENPSSGFRRIESVLDSLNHVEVIPPQARACVLSTIFKRKGNEDLNMHQASRPFPGRVHEYNFTLPQLDRMFNRTIKLMDKFSVEPLSSKPEAYAFVDILEQYNEKNYVEYYRTVDQFLEDFVHDEFGDRNCKHEALTDIEIAVCSFMKEKDNHDIFSNGYFPDDFPYIVWLHDRSNEYLLTLPGSSVESESEVDAIETEPRTIETAPLVEKMSKTTETAPLAKTSVWEYNAQLARYYTYRFYIETSTSGLKYEGTDSTVVFRLMRNYGSLLDPQWSEVYQDHKLKVKDRGWEKVIDFTTDSGSYSDGIALNKLTIEVHIEGNDAMMIDRAKLKKINSDHEVVAEKEFGVNNGKGWCLSEDPDDINGSWRDAASGCYPALSFNGAGAVTRQPAEANHRKYESYDRVCIDMSTKKANLYAVGTYDKVEFRLFEGNTLHDEVYDVMRVGGPITAGLLSTSWCNEFSSTSSGSTGLQLKISGDDELLIDKIEMTRYGGANDRKNTLVWGADNTRGFCLSTDSSNPFGSLATGCYECIEFREGGVARVCGTDVEVNG